MVDEALAKKVAASGSCDDNSNNNDNAEAANKTWSWSSYQFWEFIDQLLNEMREKVRGEPDTERQKVVWGQ